jgi:histidinol-phosphate aminotransferase
VTAVPAPTTLPAVVRLSSNENPYGPPPAAFAAKRDAFDSAWRYPDEREDVLVEALAAAHGVGRDQILLGNGSSQILDLAAAACTGPAARLVIAEPTFEAIARYAAARGAAIERVKLTSDCRHDDIAMAAAAAKGAGLVYVCNPNNPTATLTPAARIGALVANVPATTVVLIDEAYHHYAEQEPGYESALQLVARHPNVVVARTFSKIYGMAGLRCGYAVGRPETIRRLRDHRPWDSINLMALVAARAALDDPAHLERARRSNAEVRAWTAGELERSGWKVPPSAANFLMADLHRDVGPVISALAAAGVEVGRRFAALPTHLRVTIGVESDMRRCLVALRQVMKA